MATYSVNASKSISGGTTALFTLPKFTVPDGEKFKRFKITLSGDNYTGYTLQGDSASIGWNNWSTNKEKLHWSNGTSSKVWVSSSSTRSTRVIVTFETEELPKYQIGLNRQLPSTCVLSANKTSAYKGDTITITAVPNTGRRVTELYYYDNNNNKVTISNNTFKMPAYDISVYYRTEIISYAITKAASPAAGGTVSGPSTANAGSQVTMSQTPNSGYHFDGWQISGGGASINSSGVFTMPAAAVTVTAKYSKRSTASVNNKTMTGGGTALLTIVPDKTTYTHKYKLSFGTNMETGWTNVNAGVTSVNISIPTSWANQIPTATQKTGGTLVVETYNGSTKIGEYSITGLTYVVQDSAKPEIGTITKSIARTIGGKTYANVGDYYVQNHCGVRVQTSASSSQGATITSIKVTISGHTYTTTVNASSVDWTTGLLYTSGTITITVVATDSRGRTTTKTTTITVTAYSKPSGTLKVKRVDTNGNDDDTDVYAKYEITSSFKAIGSNSLTRTLKVTISGTTYTGTPSSNTGNLLPNSRKTFNAQSEYNIQLVLTDQFETTTITTKLPSAKFIIFIDSAGNRMAFFKAVTKSVPTGKNRVLEISDDTAFYIGATLFEDWIPYVFTKSSYTDRYMEGVCGFITTSSTNVHLFIPMIVGRNITAINITKMEAAIRHAGGGYLLSNGADLAQYINQANVYRTQGGVRVELIKNDGWGITNNTPLVGVVTMSFTLS